MLSSVLLGTPLQECVQDYAPLGFSVLLPWFPNPYLPEHKEAPLGFSAVYFSHP
jgi:hypothetical protein